MNPVVIVVFLAGCLVMGASLPFILGKVKMNEVAGVRTAAAFSSEANWYKINRYGGRMLLRYGAVLCLTASIGLFVKQPLWVAYNWVSFGVVAAGLIWFAGSTTLYGNRLMARGRRRKRFRQYPARLWISLGIALLALSGFAFWNGGSAAHLKSVKLTRPSDDRSPGYEVTIYSDGRVAYFGLLQVQFAGRRERRISPETFAEIEKKVKQIRFTQMQDRYRIPGLSDEDVPGAITTVTSANDSKTILDFADAPAGLNELEDLIDRVAGTAEWIGNGPANAVRVYEK